MVRFADDGRTVVVSIAPNAPDGPVPPQLRRYDARTGRPLGPRRSHRPGGRDLGADRSLPARPPALLPAGTPRSWSTRQRCACGGGSRWGRSAPGSSPDGRSVALGGEDGSVAILDLRTGERRTLAGRHEDRVHGLAFSADGRTLATRSDDGRVLVWDLRSGEVRETLTGHTGAITDLVVERRRAHALHRRAGRPGHRLGHRRRPPPRPPVPGKPIRQVGEARLPAAARDQPVRPDRRRGAAGRRRAPARRAHAASPARPAGDRGRTGDRGRVQPRRSVDRRDGRGRARSSCATQTTGRPRAATATRPRRTGTGDGVLARWRPPRRGGPRWQPAGAGLGDRRGPPGAAARRASRLTCPSARMARRWRSGSTKRHRAARRPVARLVARLRDRAGDDGRLGSLLAGWPAAGRQPPTVTRSCGTWPRAGAIGPPLSGPRGRRAHCGVLARRAYARDERIRRHRDPLGRRVAALARNAPRAARLDVEPASPLTAAGCSCCARRGGAALGGRAGRLVAARVSRRGAGADASGVGGAGPGPGLPARSAPSPPSIRSPAAASATRRRAAAPRSRAGRGDASRRPECRTCRRGWRGAA